MTATVVGGEGAVVETDELGRIAVVFHWERTPDVSVFAVNFPQFPVPPTRVRYVNPGAGQGVGMQYLPRVGDEVLILFIDNDPDKPIAVGSVHNGALGTPSFGGVSSLPKDAALTGLRTGEHKGVGANEMVFDDTTGEVGLRLGSTTAATDLNLGHITTPRKQGNAATRGEGAELRTEGAAALRAAQGLLLTTYSASKSAPHLEHDDLSKLLIHCKELLESIESRVVRSPNLPDSAEGRQAMSEKLSTWADGTKDSRPAIAITAPEGIVCATKSSLVQFAGTDMDLVAGGCLQLHTGKQASIAAAAGVAIHAVDSGIAVHAERGSVVLSAHDGPTTVEAKSDVLVTAAEGKVQIHGPVIELIGGDGSYIRLGDGIEIGSPKDIRIKAPNVHIEPGASLPADVATRGSKGESESEVIYGSRPHEEPAKRGTRWKRKTT